MIVGLPTMLFGRRAVFALARLWGAISVWLLEKICGLRLEYRGIENIPPGAVLIAAKHQSFLETFALLKYAPDFAIILKRQLTYVPLFGLYLIVSKQIAIDRARGRQALQQIAGAAKPVFAAGRQVFIYPEGTRRLPGAPPKYKQGVTALYLRDGRRPACRSPSTPGLFWRRRGFLRRPGLAVIEYLPVIAPGLDRAEFSKRLQSTIETACDRLNAEAVSEGPVARGGPCGRGEQRRGNATSVLTIVLLCSINVLVIIRVGTMTLAYENETVDRACGFCEQPTSPWIAVGERSARGEARGASLAALAGMPISSRFCSWIGLSGRRYVFSVYPASECPAFCDAVLLAAVRDVTGRRRVLSVRETGAFPEPVVARAQRELRAFGPGSNSISICWPRRPRNGRRLLADLAIAET